MSLDRLWIVAAVLCVMATPRPAAASAISWTTASVGSTSVSAQGTAGDITVTYAGEVESLFVNYPAFSNAAYLLAPY